MCHLSIVIFAIGSVLCGCAQVSPFDHAKVRPDQELDKYMAHSSSCLFWSWGRRHSSVCMGDYLRDCAVSCTCKVVASSQRYLELFSRRRATLGRRVQFWCARMAVDMYDAIARIHRKWLTDEATVFLNIPICVVASALLTWSLRHVTLSKTNGTTLRHLALNFDFIGL